MNRLRKLSDAKSAKKSQSPILPPILTSHSPTKSPQGLPELPSADDFRTSLILPDLTRRFSLLRNSSGEPLPVDLLRSRLAEQRARGVENHISEEEEDMILESLGLRTKYSAPSTDSSESAMRQSARSTSTLTYSPSTSRSAKRYSNNLFGSGRLRDYSYARSVTSQGRHTSSRVTSAAPSEASSASALTSSHEIRPLTPENDAAAIRSAPLIPLAPYSEQSPTEYTLSKSLSPAAFKRASSALEEVIRELEEDAEDEVVMPRSAPITRANGNTDNAHPQLIDVYEAGMAISSDRQARTTTDEKRTSPIPSHILPGYIPGMPRPMTPRDEMDNDGLRSHSITPRAGAVTSFHGSSDNPPTSQSTSEHAAHGSLSSFTRPSSRPMSPPFLQRSPIDPTQRGERSLDLADFESHSSVVPGRKRPASPLSGPSYQPFTAAAVSTSRPSTPSNVTWTIPASKSSPQKGHNRSGSWFSDAEGSTDPHGGYSVPSNDHSKSASRSLRSPALPDSPILERTYVGTTYFGTSYAGGSYDNRPPSAISGMDLSSPPSSRPIRSPTPTQSPARSPTSPVFSGVDVSPKRASRRSSKQNGSSSIPFTTSSYNPVIFSPLANSSRSSLESTGSSYHTWEAENKFSFVDADSQQPAWHELSFSSTSTTPGGSPDTEFNPEDVIGSYAGLLKSDFSAIQEKLVSAVASKNSGVPESRERTNSLRRRRPSTSQSNYSLNYRNATPPPQQSPPLDVASSLNNDQISKASALLNSVVDSINQNKASQEISPPPIDTADVQPSSREVSPATRRNRDLAEVLFGSGEGEATPEGTPEDGPSAGVSRPISPEEDISQSNVSKEIEPFPKIPPSSATPSLNTVGLGLSAPSPSAFSPLRSPSTPHIPQTPEAQADLAREVQRKTEAAMIALRKRPSNPNLSKEGLVSPGSVRKKIHPNQISTPTLVSASTSVDTIPLRTPPLSMSSGPPSKIGSRFRKLRGTLRKGNLPIEEIKVTPYPLDMRSNPSDTGSQSQFARYDSAKLHPIEAVSATEVGRFHVPAVPVPSPPASAGPGLKGFMARFRGKGRSAEPVDFKGQQQLRVSPRHVASPQSAPLLPTSPLAEDAKSPRDMHSQFLYPPHSSSSVPAIQHPSSPLGDKPDASPQETQALQQLFNAANDLGLDQGQLSELLARSGSISSKSTDWTMLTRSHSSTAKSRQENRNDRQFQSPTPQSEWSAYEEPGQRASKMPLSVSRKSSLKQNDNVGVRRPRQQRGQDDTNTIVRRTIIYPEDRGTSIADLNALVRKGSSRRRRASALSASSSNRSVYERVPTPPPPRSPTAKRFSTDESPPVPQLPQAWANRMDKGLLGLPPAGGQAYDSVYDMYDDKGSQSAALEAGSSSQEPGPALELIELANGETIWSIVNGLRDDDTDSLYAGRSSFQSDYDNDESVQVLVKDHTRSGSKGSNSSFLSRRKLAQPKNRPETKVFYTSSAQIGRLIENLSRGMDAGTFNFSQGQSDYTMSSSSSMTGQTGSDYLTVEERLEHMLGAMNP
ncbi:hypothetical protein GYMLUDRAFT_44306 [Collybiopsis luxurians FD-317 M1]|uniref:Uncharacterized protein n=1 Tax=Collybiopsis luxurians FD-317 M1 TaxID=944289 RepID=A0A0D0CV55_9AGAR|nr:hypothetical protein GYMLUDRAFT_44306 [Collybiopsis luxurians FD-317 M1]